jgi:hypothetical protein
MEQQRTITKLRSLKVGVMLFLLLFSYGTFMSVYLELRQEKVVVNLRNKATEVLSYKYKNDMSYAVRVCNDAYDYMKKSADESIVFGLVGLVFTLFLIRISMHQRIKVAILLLFGLGGGMIALYHLSVGILLPKTAMVVEVRKYMSWLFYPAYVFYGLGMIMFVYHVFRKIVVAE